MKRLLRLWLVTQRWGGTIIGPLFISLASIWTVQTISFVHHAQRTTGTVTELVPSRDDDGDLQYAAVFQYSTPDGIVHRRVSEIHSKPAGYLTGQQVGILYNGEEPDSAKIDSFLQLWLFPVAFGISGVLASLFAVWLWTRHLRS